MHRTSYTDSAERKRKADAARRKANPWRIWYKTKRWQARRAEQLAAFPDCAMCAQHGSKTPATVADHIQAHKGSYARFFFGALQSLCKRCHDKFKQAQERGKRAGCDVSGLPVDSSHPWA